MTDAGTIILPERVVIRLCGEYGSGLPNVLFTVRILTHRKNDFRLGPFATDADGVSVITRSALLSEAAAHYDSGLMDYEAIESCRPDVIVEAMTSAEVERALAARTLVWTTLLRGESDRWSSIEALRQTYRTAANHRIAVEPIRDRWDGRKAEYEYTISLGS